MQQEAVRRTLGVAICLGILSGLFILGGVGWPTDPGSDVGPSVDGLAGDSESNVGEEIADSGIIIDADAQIVELENENIAVKMQLEGENGELSGLEQGEEITFYGEIIDAGVIEVHPDRTATREPWERQYMYAISVVGAMITVLVGGNYWRFRLRQLRFEPRDRPLIPLLGGDHDG